MGSFKLSYDVRIKNQRSYNLTIIRWRQWCSRRDQLYHRKYRIIKNALKGRNAEGVEIKYDPREEGKTKQLMLGEKTNVHINLWNGEKSKITILNIYAILFEAIVKESDSNNAVFFNVHNRKLGSGKRLKPFFRARLVVKQVICTPEIHRALDGVLQFEKFSVCLCSLFDQVG